MGFNSGFKGLTYISALAGFLRNIQDDQKVSVHLMFVL